MEVVVEEDWWQCECVRKRGSKGSENVVGFEEMRRMVLDCARSTATAAVVVFSTVQVGLCLACLRNNRCCHVVLEIESCIADLILVIWTQTTINRLVQRSLLHGNVDKTIWLSHSPTPRCACHSRCCLCTTFELIAHASTTKQQSCSSCSCGLLIITVCSVHMEYLFLALSLTMLNVLATEAERTIPPSLVLLPLESISNASLIASYNCNPTYAADPCSGHGDCLLLVDKSLPSSFPFLNASSAQPIPASSILSNSINPAGDFFLQEPTAICACHAHWSGKGDYINHFAFDGDSCGMNQQAVLSMGAALLALFVPLMLLSLVRLFQWWFWLWSCQPPSHVRGDGLSQSPQSIHRNNADHNESQWSVLRKRSVHLMCVLRAECTNIAFVHPLCSLLHSVFVATFLARRISTDDTAGSSWLMSAMMYAQNIPSIIALCANASSRLCVASAVVHSRTNQVSIKRLIMLANRSFFGACLYAAGAWLLVFLAHGKQGTEQQLYAVLILTVMYCSDLSTGLVLVLTTLSIVRTLSLHLDCLSVEQRGERLALASKLRSQAVEIIFAIIVNIAAVLLLVSVPSYRQSGLPYFALIRFFFTAIQAAARFYFIQPPKRSTAVLPNNPPSTFIKSRNNGKVELPKPLPREADNATSTELVTATRAVLESQ